MGKKMKVFVLVKVYQLIVDSVEVFKTFKEAKKRFEVFVDHKYKYGDKRIEEDDDYDQTKIFEAEI